MTFFHQALELTLANEGGYANDADDPGGETYCGISRRHHPDWSGWPLIDAGAHFRQRDPALVKAVSDLYRRLYWTPIRGAELGSQELAAEVFDTAVNMGVARASAMLQEALNLLNRDGASWPEIDEDGRIGRKTLAALDKALGERGGAGDLVRLYRVLRGMFYVELTRRRPSQEKYLRGWLRRLSPSKE